MGFSGYPEYLQRTSSSVPLPPKKSPSGSRHQATRSGDVSILERSTKETT